MTCSMGMARTVPNRIPPTITGLIKAPISPRSPYRTYSGVIITHSEVIQPFEKAKRNMFVTLNQSVLKM